MRRRSTHPTGWRYTSWKYQGNGEVFAGDRSVANVTCDLKEREYLLEVNELGSRKPAVGVERREIRGQITVQGTDKEILKQFKPPLDLQLLDREDKPRLKISHTATKRVSTTGIYDVVEFS